MFEGVVMKLGRNEKCYCGSGRKYNDVVLKRMKNA